MPQNMIENLKNEISKLEAFKRRTESQQISYPLDAESQTIITHDLLSPTGNFVVPSSFAAPYDEFIEVTVNGRKYLLETTKIRQ